MIRTGLIRGDREHGRFPFFFFFLSCYPIFEMFILPVLERFFFVSGTRRLQQIFFTGELLFSAMNATSLSCPFFGLGPVMLCYAMLFYAIWAFQLRPFGSFSASSL